VLGAVGVNVGTRFLASVEAEIADDWKRAILEAQSEDTARASFASSASSEGVDNFATSLPGAYPSS
jgi:NAD(P)H-dependent flavin oxidoreductase YrpB (nitropropane dioxygenase family)